MTEYYRTAAIVGAVAATALVANLGWAAYAYTSGSGGKAPHYTDATESTPAPTPTSEPSPRSTAMDTLTSPPLELMGHVSDVDGWRVEVTGVDYRDHLPGARDLEDATEWLVLDVHATNGADHPRVYDQGSAVLTDVDGRVYHDDWAAVYDSIVWDSFYVELNPGQSVDTLHAFAVPTDMEWADLTVTSMDW